jgi:phosphate transport system permease protein
MTTTIASRRRDPLGLATRTMPRWAFPALAAGVLAVSLAVFAATPLQGNAGFVVFAVVAYAVAQTAVSFGVEGRRHAVNRLMSTCVYLCFALAILPLGLVLYKVAAEGAHLIDGAFLTHSLRNVAPRDPGGGVYHGIVGTLEQALITSLISIPIAVLVAVYLVEYGKGTFARSVTFFVDVMTGIPSIVAGLFIFTAWILVAGFHRSGFAATLALAILMIPVVVRSTEEMLKLVPDELREASYALGVPKWRTILRVVIPTALAGIVTGIMLGVARVMGETAPLLLLNGFTTSINMDPFHGPQAALPLIVWDQAGRPNDAAVARAWGAALTLIILVMLLNLLARFIARLRVAKTGR